MSISDADGRRGTLVRLTASERMALIAAAQVGMVGAADDGIRKALSSTIDRLRDPEADPALLASQGVPEEWRLQVVWSARQRSDGSWEPGQPISGNAISKAPADAAWAEIVRMTGVVFGRLSPDEPFFLLDAPFRFVPSAPQPEGGGHGG